MGSLDVGGTEVDRSCGFDEGYVVFGGVSVVAGVNDELRDVVTESSTVEVVGSDGYAV